MIDYNSPICLRLDSHALVSNWKALAKLSGSAVTGAAVKADGYGLGAPQVVKRLWNAGCRDFFVAHWAEAAKLVDIIPPGHIAVLNGIGEGDVNMARSLGAIPVLNTPLQVNAWKEAGGGQCHVMLDTGINRLGIGPEQAHSGLFEGLDIDILLSHLASADEDVQQNQTQLKCFYQISSSISCKRRSFANSAGIMLGDKYHFDLTRPGLSLYGGIARSEMSGIIKPVVYIKAKVLQIRELNRGEPIGYNAAYRCTEPVRTATLAIGYADGYARAFSNKGQVWFGGYMLPVIGKVSMDLLVVDASTVPLLHEGDLLDVDYDLQNAGAVSGLSQYELLTGLSKRARISWT